MSVINRGVHASGLEDGFEGEYVNGYCKSGSVPYTRIIIHRIRLESYLESTEVPSRELP